MVRSGIMVGIALSLPTVAIAQTPGAVSSGTATTAGGASATAGTSGGQAPTATVGATTADVLVVAETGSQQSIDRKSYVIRQGPAAEVANGIDVMKDLPSVSVDAAGAVELLGNGNVRILIDGRPVPDALTVLRGLSAAQIARVEVITNPSAQFTAEGTAGIINVITRRSSRDGLGGTLTAGGDSRGGGILRAGPTWTQGRWTLSTSPTLFAQRGETRGELERERLAGPPDGVTDRSERSVGRQATDGFASRTQLVFRPDAKRSLSAALSTNAVQFDNDARTRVSARADAFTPFEQRTSGDGSFGIANLVTDYRAEGDRQGELFTVSATGSAFRYDYRNLYRETPLSGGAASALAVESRSRDRQAVFKLDYATPIGTKRRLSIGGSLDWHSRELRDRAVGAGLLGPEQDTASQFGGAYLEGAAYGTLQTSLGSFKLLPGLRVQGRRYALDDLGDDGPARLDLFPSVFVERQFGTRLTGVASYSRRISYPDIGFLAPQLRFQSPTLAFRGNPDVAPEITDALELRLSRSGQIHSLDLTLYDRITHGTFDRTVTLNPDGVIVTSPVNAGSRIDQGLEAAVRGRVATSLRYSLTGNLTAVTRDIGTIGNRRRDAQYRGKLQLDYTDGKAADPGFDQITFNLRYEGPARQFQYRREDYLDADLSWTHRLTPRLSLVTAATALLGSVAVRSETRTPFIRERRRDEGVGRTLRLALSYQLSTAPQQQPPPTPAIPPVPIP